MRLKFFEPLVDTLFFWVPGLWAGKVLLLFVLSIHRVRRAVFLRLYAYVRDHEVELDRIYRDLFIRGFQRVVDIILDIHLRL